jgi:hypothetical protein
LATGQRRKRQSESSEGATNDAVGQPTTDETSGRAIDLKKKKQRTFPAFASPDPKKKGKKVRGRGNDNGSAPPLYGFHRSR